MNIDHEVFFGSNFYPRFEQDLENARGLVIIQSPFVAMRRITRLQSHLMGCTQRSVRICIVVQEPRAPTDEAEMLRLNNFQAAKQLLTSLGGSVSTRPRIHEKLAVIDEEILWEGSLNILSQNNSKERMNRWVSREKVYEATGSHKLACYSGSMPVGQYIAARRQSLGISQAELSRRSKVAPAIICGFERGKRDIKLRTLERICRELRLEHRCLPLFMLPSLDQIINEVDS